jgi:hypothetical protein
MKRRQLMLAAIVAAFLPAQAALAQDRDRTQDQTRDQIRDRDIYGSQLMTQQERNEYRQRMQQARTAEERERIRVEHHERMKVRAKERGVTLPDQPPARPGRPMGPGGGAGPGGGRGR